MNKNKAINALVTEEVKAQLMEMADYTDDSQADVLALAITAMYGSFVKRRELSEEKARQSMEMFETLKQRLGDDFYKGAGGVGFAMAPEDRVIVSVADVRYFKMDNSDKLVATRDRGGRAEFAEVTEDGLGEWMAAPLADPSLN